MSTIEELLCMFPSLYLKNLNFTNFVGNLKTKDGVFRIDISLPQFPKISDMKIRIFEGFEERFIDNAKLNYDWNVKEFLVEFPMIVNSKSISSFENDYHHYQNHEFVNIIAQICELRSPDYKVLVKKSYTQFKITNFTNYEQHYLELKINNNNEIEVTNHSLPLSSDNYDLFRSSNSISCYIQQFRKLLEQLDEFYENIHAIDELCYVVEPIDITTKDNWRIFKLNEKNVFIKITVDPFSPSSVVVNLMGPTYDVEKYRNLYNERASSWDIEMDIYKNLLRIFELFYFPMKPPANHQTTNEEENFCNICYTYNLDNHIPIISCDNEKCDINLHVDCLKEWFATLMDGKTFLSVTLGTCPYCKEKLSASFTHLLDF